MNNNSFRYYEERYEAYAEYERGYFVVPSNELS